LLQFCENGSVAADMKHENIIFLRNFFFRAFVIGLLFALLFLVLTLTLWNTWTGWGAHLFAVDEKDLSRIVLQFFTLVRIVLIFFFLVPALALHWMAKKQQP
jgi:hypothetical protein